MAGMRVLQLAREYGLTNREMLEKTLFLTEKHKTIEPLFKLTAIGLE